MDRVLLNSSVELRFDGNRRRTFGNVKPGATNARIFSTAQAMTGLVRPTLNRVQRTTNELLIR